MGEVVLYIAASVDGFIARKDGDVSWLEKFNEGGEDYGYKEFYRGIGASIMGSHTYVQAVGFGQWDKKMPTYVITKRKLEKLPGAKIEFYSGDLGSLVGRLKKETAKDIWLVGGGRLAQSFLDAGLVDRIILSVIPVLLGEGIPLFAMKGKERELRLIGSKSYETGIVQMDFKVE